MNHAVIANQSADWCGDPPEFQEIATSGFALLAMTCLLFYSLRSSGAGRWACSGLANILLKLSAK